MLVCQTIIEIDNLNFDLPIKKIMKTPRNFEQALSFIIRLLLNKYRKMKNTFGDYKVSDKFYMTST